ncbi:MAG: hypothetical protein ACTSYI_00050 [Promethearchaeota archaeon]
MKIALVVDPAILVTLEKNKDAGKEKKEEEEEEEGHPLQVLEGALEKYGNRVTFLHPDDQLLSKLQDGKFDFILNTADKVATKYQPAQYVGLFDLAKIPYLGSRLDAIGICKNKALFKSILQLNFIATPKFQILKIQSGKIPKVDPNLRFPLIIKFFHEGIHEASIADIIIQNPEEIDDSVKNIIKKKKFSYAIIEEYIPSRKFYLPIFGNDLNDDIHFLPAVEYQYPPEWTSEERIKAHNEDLEKNFLEITNPLVKRARKVAHKAYTFCNCRDFAMAVFLVDEKTNNLLLHEINPITDLLPGGKMALAAEHVGLSYREMINDLILTALKRYDMKLRGKYGKREKKLQKEQDKIDLEKESQMKMKKNLEENSDSSQEETDKS